MTENSDLDRRLSDLERRHNKTREWLIDFISIVVAMSTVILLNVDRTTTWTSEFVVISVLELVVAYFVTRRVTRWAMELGPSPPKKGPTHPRTVPPGTRMAIFVVSRPF
jgi:hypothetical protein